MTTFLYRQCLPLVIVSIVFSLHAGDSKKPTIEELEAKEAAEEDRLMEGKHPETGYEFSARGRMQLLPMEVGKTPPVLGTFRADGKTYQIKIATEDMRTRLAPYHNKDVALAGKIRNNGKYLIVENILEGSGVPAATHRNPRGL